MTQRSTPRTDHVWISLFVGGAFLLTGCATQKKDIFPQDLEPMTTIYDQHFVGLRTQGIAGARSKLHAPREMNVPVAPEETSQFESTKEVSGLGDGGSPPAKDTIESPVVKGNGLNLKDYTRTAVNELNVLFPLLPNPTLVMYVYPHLAEERAGVPGYVTQFRFYERDEYALPGEVPEADVNP